MIKTKALLFDLDGTLLDTAPEFAYCLNLLLQQEGRQPISLKQLKPMISFGAKAMIEFGFNITEHDPAFYSLKQRLLSLYLKNLGSLTQLFPGVSQLIAQLELKNISWGIVTNKPKTYTFALVERFAPLHQAQCVVAGDSLPTQKPDPAPLLFACQTLNVSTEECWYIGDAKTDRLASGNAQMRCAIAHYGYIPIDEDPKSWQAEYYLNSVEEITDLF